MDARRWGGEPGADVPNGSCGRKVGHGQKDAMGGVTMIMRGDRRDRRTRRQIAGVPLGLLAMLLAVAACGEAPQPDTPQQAAATCAGLAEPGMVWIAGGRFTMGKNPPLPRGRPAA